jgi:hypothetical protein
MEEKNYKNLLHDIYVKLVVLEKDSEKNFKKGTVSAGRRARKTAREIKNILDDLRRQIMVNIKQKENE